MEMSNTNVNVSSYYLDSANQNRLRNEILTDLSKKYNIQPMLGQLNTKYTQISNYIASKVQPDSRLTFQQNLERLNRLTYEQTMKVFSGLFATAVPEPVAVPEPTVPASQNVMDANKGLPRVDDLYSQLMSEREYIPVSSQTPSVPTSVLKESDNGDCVPLDTSLTFQQRMDVMRQNRNLMMEQRNRVDLQTREQNYRTAVLGEAPVETARRTLEDTTTQGRIAEQNDVENVGRRIVSDDEKRLARYDEYRTKDKMDYRSIHRQFYLSSKDRLWVGGVSSSNPPTILNALEPYRYRFQLNNNRQVGIYLQNRHKNITSIRVVAVYINKTESDSTEPPYVFVHIPELENRVETSIPSRKFVFSILTKDDDIGNQIKYVNFLTNNQYYPTPLSELNNLTFEILSPTGALFSEAKDDLKITNIGADTLVANNATSIVFTLNRYYRSTQFDNGERLIVRNFDFYGANVPSMRSELAAYINREEGHRIVTPQNTLDANTYYNRIHIEIPRTLLDDGTFQLDGVSSSFLTFLNANTNNVGNVYGTLMNSDIQPAVVLEITKIEPNSGEISQSMVQVI